MSIFDKLKSTAQQAVSKAAQSIGSKRETFTFTSLPESPLPKCRHSRGQASTRLSKQRHSPSSLSAPYAADRNIRTEMLNWLRGPRPLNGQDISFLNDRFRDEKDLSAAHLFCWFHTGQ